MLVELWGVVEDLLHTTNTITIKSVLGLSTDLSLCSVIMLVKLWGVVEDLLCAIQFLTALGLIGTFKIKHPFQIL